MLTKFKEPATLESQQTNQGAKKVHNTSERSSVDELINALVAQLKKRVREKFYEEEESALVKTLFHPLRESLLGQIAHGVHSYCPSNNARKVPGHNNELVITGEVLDEVGSENWWIFRGTGIDIESELKVIKKRVSLLKEFFDFRFEKEFGGDGVFIETLTKGLTNSLDELPLNRLAKQLCSDQRCRQKKTS